MDSNNGRMFLSVVCAIVSLFMTSRLDAQPRPALPFNRDEPIPVTDALPAPTMLPGFGIPDGLSTPASELLPALGFGTASCFPLTSDSCFDVAYKCLCSRRYEDALAFANHGLKLSNQARHYLLKAMCELELSRCDDAQNTLIKYRYALALPEETVGFIRANEKLNGPARVRLEILLKAMPR